MGAALLKWIAGWRWQSWLLLALLIGNGGQAGVIVWKNKTIRTVEAEKATCLEKVNGLNAGEQSERAIANDQANDVSAAVDRADVILGTSKKRAKVIEALPPATTDAAAIDLIRREYPRIKPW